MAQLTNENLIGDIDMVGMKKRMKKGGTAKKKRMSEDETNESFKSLAKKVDKQKGVDKDYAGKIAGKIANIKRKGGGSGPTAKQKKRMAEDETNESFGSLAKKIDKQKGKSKKDAANIAGYIANIKRKGGGSGPTAKQKKRMNEVRIDRDVADKIEGMLSRPLKAQFLDAFDDLWEDLTEDDMFYPEDVINHLNNEMHKRLRLYRTPDPKPEEIPMFMGTRDALDDISIREALPKFKGVPPKPSIIRALKVDGNGTKMEIDSYMASVKRSGDEFDDVDDYVEDFKNYIADKSLQEQAEKRDIRTALKQDAKGTDAEIDQYFTSLVKAGDEFDTMDDYVEDFKNYVADKSLQEHFGRFMKDYQ